MKDDTPLIRACRACGLDFGQARRKGWPEQYCSRPECLEIRNPTHLPAYRRAARAAERGIEGGVVRLTCQNPECGREFEVPYGRGNLPHHCSPGCRRTNRQQQRRSETQELPPRAFICQNPECGIEFQRENKPGHPPACCSTPCRRRRRAATIQLQAWLEANPGKKTEDYRAFVHSRPGRAARDFRTFPLDEVLARDDGICYLCGEEVVERGFSGRAATRDHLVPLGLGGENSWENIFLAHRVCNSGKHTRTLDEYLALYPRKRELPVALAQKIADLRRIAPCHQPTPVPSLKT